MELIASFAVSNSLLFATYSVVDLINAFAVTQNASGAELTQRRKQLLVSIMLAVLLVGAGLVAIVVVLPLVSSR